MAQAARRPRVMLDTLAERPFLPRFFPRGDVFLRFGRSFVRAGRECDAKSGDVPSIGFTGASMGFTGAGGAIILCASLRPFIGSSPKANLTMAPYHLNIDSAVPSHNVAGVAIPVRSAVPASRGAVPSTTCRSASRNESPLITNSSRVKVIRKRCRTAVFAFLTLTVLRVT
jgi:hypothetical protein